MKLPMTTKQVLVHVAGVLANEYPNKTIEHRELAEIFDEFNLGCEALLAITNAKNSFEHEYWFHLSPNEQVLFLLFVSESLDT